MTEEPLKFSTGWAWLIFYFKKYRRQLVRGTVFVFCSVTFGVFVPRYVGNAIDDLRLNGVTMDKLLRSVAVIVGTSFISGIFLYLQRRTLINMSRYIEYDLRQDFYGHLQKTPASIFSATAHGRFDGAGDQ